MVAAGWAVRYNKGVQERYNKEKENSPARTKGPAQLKEIL